MCNPVAICNKCDPKSQVLIVVICFRISFFKFIIFKSQLNTIYWSLLIWSGIGISGHANPVSQKLIILSATATQNYQRAGTTTVRL